MPVARRRGEAAGLAGREASRVTSGCTASSRPAVVRQLTDIIQLPATTLPGRPDQLLPTRGVRGRRGLGGHASIHAELVSAARAQVAEPGKNSPGQSPLSRRFARREAIGLPRFGDPEDHRVVAGSARWVGAPLGECDQQQVPGACCRRLPPLQASAGSAGIPPAAVLPRCSPLPLTRSGPSECQPGWPVRRRRNRGTRFRGRGRARLPVEGNE